MSISHVRAHVSQKYPQVIPWIIWIFAVVFYLYQMILRISSSVLADDWMASFNLTAGELGLLSGAYYYSYGVLQIPAGIAMDRWGPRVTLSIAAIVCGVGCAIMAQAPTYTVAFLGRFLMGIGASCGFLGCLKIASLWFKPSQVGLIAGLSTSLGMIGGIIGNVPFAALNALYSWRSIQWMLAIIGGCIALIIWIGIRTPHVRRKELDAEPMVPEKETVWKNLQQIMSSRQSWIISVFGFCMYVPLAAFTDLWGISFFKIALNISETEASSLNSLTYIGLLLGAPMFAVFSDRLQSHRKTMRISAILFCSMFAMVILSPYMPRAVVPVFCLLFGVSFGGEVIAFVSVANTMPRNISGLCNGFTNTVVVASGILFQPLVGSFIALFSYGNSPSTQSYMFAFIPVLITACGAIFLTFFMIETHPTVRKPHIPLTN